MCIAAGIALVILYGSLYPFGFYPHHDPRGPLGVLLENGFRYGSRDDVIANVLLYIPFGFFAAYAIERQYLAAAASATLAGFVLSVFVELIQFYDHGRVQDLSDICSNTLGALLGASAGIFARRRGSSPYLALLLACWLGNRVYPALQVVPTARLGPFLLVSSIPLLDLFLFFVAWLAVGLMLETLCGASRSRVALPALLAASLLIRALAVDVEHAEIAGGVAAVLLWSIALWRWRARAPIAAVLFLALVVLLALEPFHFLATAHPFGWVPFRSFLEDKTDHAILVLFEKAFLYGGMVWLLVRAGLSAGAATALGAALVFCLRLIQVYLPGRSAEITDAILVLMLAAMMKLVLIAGPKGNACPRSAA
jgi:VanZ family protein